MPLAKSYAISLIGLNGSLVEVEADISSNLPGFVIVGLPDASLSEATARVRAATVNSSLPLPNRKLTVNLSPAAIPKFGSSFDLAIAIAALRAAGTIKNQERFLYVGELGLDGSVRPVRGVLPSVLSATHLGFEKVMVPQANFAEASLVGDIEVVGVDSLSEAVARLAAGSSQRRIQVQPSHTLTDSAGESQESSLAKDVADIYGQPFAIEALKIAAAGGHHMLMIGSPGVGKTMMAERLPGLLPDLAIEYALETTALHSISASRNRIGSQLVVRPPFEAPHHSASSAAMIGGGKGVPTPGLVSLAHNGVLFLDEAPEFQLPALESLRQAIESGEVTIARSAGIARFPARFQLVLAANPCPCGFAMSKKASCRCTPMARQRYLTRLSGPLLDRIDIRLRITEVNSAQVELDRKNPNRADSARLRAQIARAREAGAARNRIFGFELNAQAPTSALRAIYADKVALTATLDRALRAGQINLRGYDRCLRVALTIADLAGREVEASDIAQAMILRGEDQLGAA